jgi:hypothetical protein
LLTALLGSESGSHWFMDALQKDLALYETAASGVHVVSCKKLLEHLAVQDKPGSAVRCKGRAKRIASSC